MSVTTGILNGTDRAPLKNLPVQAAFYCLEGLTNYCCYLVMTVPLAIANTWSSVASL